MMRNAVAVVVLAAAAVFGIDQLRQGSLPIPAAVAVAEMPVRQASITAYFSPRGGCTEAIVRELNAARKSVEVQAYSFTSAPIADAVAKAHARGVQVRVILDKSQESERYSSLTYLRNHNVPTWVDTKHAIAHNKIIIVDKQTLITGSFNFSKAAEERNAENLLVIRDQPELLRQYCENFEEHLKHAQE
jgi:phosphatidylserine/phosphatidylglycerophosphate/cardiolipin synthase-like enzyme